MMVGIASVRTAAALAVGLGLALSVYLVNGAPLHYFDTAAYLDQGASILDSLGLGQDAAPASAGAAGVAGDPDDTVDTSRSAAYAVALALVDRAGAPDLAVLVNLALVAAAVLIVARRLGGGAATLPLAAAGLAAASLGALPFYTAYLMPDILTPVLILMLALLVAFAGELGRAELGAVVALAAAAAVAHPSHLLIAAVILPAILIVPALRGRHVLLVAALVGLVAGLGALERLTFTAAVERLARREAQGLPFLTARLISDGPGLDYLHAHCPDPAVATCALAAELDRSDDPMRLLAPNILFSEQPGTASFKALSAAEQRAVAAEQVAFVARVVASDPAGVLAAIARNTAIQLVFVRVDMTVPEPQLLDRLRQAYGAPADGLRNGRLVLSDRSWLIVLAYLHGALYVVSAAVLAAALLSPRTGPQTRRFVAFVLVGILANALICGAVSVPAHRYGARVAWLLPLVAGMLLGRGAGPARGPAGLRTP